MTNELIVYSTALLALLLFYSTIKIVNYIQTKKVEPKTTKGNILV